MRIFEKYQLKLKEVNGSYHVVSDNEDFQILAQFLDYWHRSKDLREDLLPELLSVINGELSDNDIGADVVGQAYVKQNVTTLEMSDIGCKDMELPTKDFRGVIMEWFEFLESQGR